MKTYTPKSIDTSGIMIPEDLMQLAEILAKNVHENWALERIRQGWQYGTERSDTQKQHPCLIPYEDLTEEEKRFDYNTAMETIKVILGLGYQIEKKSDGELA